MKKILLLLVVAITFSSCEKDDICSEETTPRLIIEFYDIANPTILKNVSSLEVIGAGVTEPLKNFSGVSSIELPLKITEDITQYSLKIYSNSSFYANEDKIQFKYSRKNVYVSRACGYKTIFNLNKFDGVTITDSDTPDGFWIKDKVVTNTNVESEIETHVKIYC